MRVIVPAGRKESGHRIVARKNESREVGEQLTAQVEDDKEEVEGTEANDSIGLGDASRLFEVIQGGVFGQLRSSD